MDRQVVYSTVRKHLLKQKKRSVQPGSVSPTGKVRCLYRSPKGLKCAIGALIDDVHFDEKWNGETVYSGAVCGAIERSLGLNLGSLDNKDIEFLGALQAIHDEHTPANWRKCLDDFAKEHSLKK